MIWPQGGENIDLQSWLFEEDGQDFCKGAKEDYSFVGQGAFSPQAITSDDIPGWTEQDSIKWNADLNLDDCLSIDLKSKSWHQNLIGEDAKWASEVYSEYQQFLAEEKAKNSWPLDVQNSSLFGVQNHSPFGVQNPSSFGVQNSSPYDAQDLMLDNGLDMELGTDLYPLTPDSLVDNICNDIIADTNVSGDKVDFEENVYPNVPPQEEPLGQPSFENDHCMEDMSYEVEDPPQNREPEIFIENDKPQIITVPLSEAVEPKIQVINVNSVKQESPAPQRSKIIFCRRVTLPSPSALQIPTLRRSSLPLKGSPLYLRSPSPLRSSSPLLSSSHPAPSVPLKDIITEQGDDLFRDFVEMEDDVKPEFLPADHATHPASQRRRPFSQEERRLRKKEQNKRAAIRYREKKKEEQEKVFDSVEELEEQLRLAKEEGFRLESETGMVKQLLLDLLKRKMAEVEATNGMG